MDWPVFTIVRSEAPPPPEEEDYIMNGDPDPDEEIEFAIKYDEEDFFVELMCDPEYKEHVSLRTIDLLFSYDSVNCVKAVLNGETAGVLEFTADAVPWFDPGDVPILHRAAHYGAPLITKLCLPGNENQVNLRLADVFHKKGALPLNRVLRNIRICVPCLPLVVDDPLEWTTDPPQEPGPIVADVLFNLCSPALRTNHEVVRMLAPKTVGIEQEFFKYLKERKLLELATLLMVAPEIVMPGLEGHLKIRDFVQKEIAALETFMFRSNYGIENDKLILEAQTKKMEMEAVLILLQIFEDIGDKIAAYLRFPYSRSWLDTESEQTAEVTLLLKAAGLDVESELRAENVRKCESCDFMEITSRFYNDTKREKARNKMNGHTSYQALGESEKDKSYHKASSGNTIADGEKSSMLWWRNKQNLLNNFKLRHKRKPLRDEFFFSQSYHTYRPVRATRNLGSTTADKVNGLASKLQLKKQYLVRAGQDCGNLAEITRGCSRGTNLQFNRHCALPPTLCRRIVWMTSKLARAL